MLDSNNAIEVRNVSKKFKVYYDKGRTLKEKALFANSRKYEERKVLKDISFQIKKGEAVGLIGQNGCGKSTTLKLLTKIMYPDAGSIELSGRVSSLLELGAGFHPDMSGRENVYINASIFGLGRKEIDKRMDEIIAFSELEQYMDNPIRTYSSGMYMRLAFSVSIHVNADILLIDEILAVGDVNFQAKCFNRLMEIKKQGTTIVLVTHSMEQIEQLCERSIWIQDGVVKMDGPVRDVNKKYLLYMGEQKREQAQKHADAGTSKPDELSRKSIKKTAEHAGGEDYGADRLGTGEARMKYVKCLAENGETCSVFQTGQTIQFVLGFHVDKPMEKAVFGLSIFRSDGVRCYGTNGLADGIKPFPVQADGELALTFPQAMLLAGTYYIDVCIMSESSETVDYCDHAASFEIYSADGDVGMIRMEHQWEAVRSML